MSLSKSEGEIRSMGLQGMRLHFQVEGGVLLHRLTIGLTAQTLRD